MQGGTKCHIVKVEPITIKYAWKFKMSISLSFSKVYGVDAYT